MNNQAKGNYGNIKDGSVMAIVFKKLWDVVIEQFPMDIHSIHGPRHWKQVEKNGLLLADETGADESIIKLFSIFHDSRRVTNNIDDGHGLRGADFARTLRGQYFDLSDDSFEILIDACTNHTGGQNTSNMTIATCWDADRLDLPRAGITPDPERMCTAPGRRLARTRLGEGKNSNNHERLKRDAPGSH